jgi:hypothetical protein
VGSIDSYVGFGALRLKFRGSDYKVSRCRSLINPRWQIARTGRSAPPELISTAQVKLLSLSWLCEISFQSQIHDLSREEVGFKLSNSDQLEALFEPIQNTLLGLDILFAPSLSDEVLVSSMALVFLRRFINQTRS